MIVEMKINGRLCLELTPETEIESLVLRDMAAGSQKGKVTRIEAAASGEVKKVVVSVEK